MIVNVFRQTSFMPFHFSVHDCMFCIVSTDANLNADREIVLSYWAASFKDCCVFVSGISVSNVVKALIVEAMVQIALRDSATTD